ncbi:43kDa postsynaptic protein [Trema orientale]|uniref:RING-type E3 ubiquitin transferase n=1 Tax=Trema orientale TaxID=63057 RepID=A0A2P5FAF3_TREOI|nr:43kDa postsynaptic protein [Trema orientale]
MASSICYRTYFSAQNTTIRDDQPLPYPQFSLFFKFSQQYLSDDTRTDNFITEENMFQEIRVPTEYLVSNVGDWLMKLVLTQLSRLIPPLRLNHLYWRELWPREVSLGELVTKLLEAVWETVRAGSGLGRNAMGMQVTIEKRSVIPHQLFQELLGAGQPLPRSSTLDPIDLEYFGATEEETQRALMESASETVFGSVPAAKSAVEALERLIYEYDTVESNEVTCVICLENILTGSRLIRIPCSHLFHEDCVHKWLETSHNCPLCRFELPTSDDV